MGCFSFKRKNHHYLPFSMTSPWGFPTFLGSTKKCFLAAGTGLSKSCCRQKGKSWRGKSESRGESQGRGAWKGAKELGVSTSTSQILVLKNIYMGRWLGIGFLVGYGYGWFSVFLFVWVLGYRMWGIIIRSFLSMINTYLNMANTGSKCRWINWWMHNLWIWMCKTNQYFSLSLLL